MDSNVPGREKAQRHSKQQSYLQHCTIPLTLACRQSSVPKSRQTATCDVLPLEQVQPTWASKSLYKQPTLDPAIGAVRTFPAQTHLRRQDTLERWPEAAANAVAPRWGSFSALTRSSQQIDRDGTAIFAARTALRAQLLARPNYLVCVGGV
jgi:hypothetical protein